VFNYYACLCYEAGIGSLRDRAPDLLDRRRHRPINDDVDCRNQSELNRLSRLGLVGDSPWRPLIGWEASIRSAVQRMEHEQREQVCLATT
jgi:hypothetical protein